MTSRPKVSPLVLLAMLVSACSGGGGGASSTPLSPPATPGVATGTLVIDPPSTTLQARSRRPDYVSSATRYATLWIDNATPGTRVACTPGSGKTCSINWTSTSGSHKFTAAVDDSSSISGGGNLLAAFTANESLTVGSNTIPAITLDGVPAGYSYVSETLYAAGNANCPNNGVNCAVASFQVTDADGQLITGPNGLIGCPTSSQYGTITCAGTLLMASNTEATYTAYCIASGTTDQTNGVNFTVTVPTLSSNTFLSAAELSEYLLVFPTQTGVAAFPTYSCTNGTISVSGAANGTVTLN